MLEKEIQARVDFKMNELLTAVENVAKTNWNISFQSYSQKHAHYWEAFNQLKSMLQKEIQTSTPYDEMAEHRRKEKRDSAVTKILDKICPRGNREYHHALKIVVSAIEDAQDW